MEQTKYKKVYATNFVIIIVRKKYFKKKKSRNQKICFISFIVFLLTTGIIGGFLLYPHIQVYFIESGEYIHQKSFFWFASWNNLSFTALQEHAEKIDYISPVWFRIYNNGTVIWNSYLDNSQINQTIQLCKQYRIEIHPLISNYNDGFNATLISNLLSSPSSQENFIQSIINIQDQQMISYNLRFKGFNLDFENIPSTLRANYTNFLKYVRNNLPKEWIISIDVPAKTWDDLNGWGGAFNYKKILQIVDWMMIMTYDYHGPWSTPGEISPLSWIMNVEKYLSQIDPNKTNYSKIFMGIPLYGYDWGIDSGSSFSDGFSTFDLIAKQGGTKIERTEDAYELKLTYSIGDGNHIAYYSDSATIMKKLELFSNYPFSGACYWYLGLEDPKIWLEI
ncbi:glycosyl hydrolase family 18 protein [Candidatus Harpocratesius sp.]